MFICLRSPCQTARLCQSLPYCAAFADACNIRSMASVCDYPDCTGRILESERPLFPLRVILFFNEGWQRASSHEFLREALQLTVCHPPFLMASRIRRIVSRSRSDIAFLLSTRLYAQEWMITQFNSGRSNDALSLEKRTGTGGTFPFLL